MKTRHSKPDRCPRCNAAKFTVVRGFVKPRFVCGNGCTWEHGRDGGPFLTHAANFKPGETASDYVEFGDCGCVN